MEQAKDQSQQYQRKMTSRHLFMLSLGGVIGTGLFLSSGYTIHQAGPAGTILAYLVGALIVYLVMLCLGELSVAMPVTGAFHTYATKYIGPGTGYTVAWLYWLTWTVALGSEFTAAGLLMQRWFPDTSVWMWSGVFALLIFLLNAFTVKFFAESEFWFSSIKVMAIILFIILGGAAMFGLIPLKGGEAAPFFSNFTGDDGLFPNGFLPIFMTMLAVNFAFSGTELIGIAASQFMFRKRFLQEGGQLHDLSFRTPLYPVVPIAAFLLCLASVIGIAFDPNQRIALICGIPFIALCYAAYYVTAWIRKQREESGV